MSYQRDVTGMERPELEGSMQSDLRVSPGATGRFDTIMPSGSTPDFREMVLDAPETFQVRANVYTDPPLFDAEMENIFGRTWVYVAHESQIPVRGDYCSSVIGRQPVLVVHELDDSAGVYLDRCLACGSSVRYGAAGRVASVRCECRPVCAPQLARASRMGAYRGLIFASLCTDGVSLDTHLEPVRTYLDCWLGRSPLGTLTVLPTRNRYEYAGNWKWQAENGTDAYHGNYVHDSWQRVLQRAGEAPVREVRRYRDEGCTRGLRYGHGMIHRPAGLNPNASWTGRMMLKYPDYADALRSRYDPAELERISAKLNIYVFPNLYLFDTHIRTIEPIAVDQTRIEMLVYALDGIPRDLNEDRYRAHERFFGNSGFGTPDDVEVFLSSQTGVRARSVEWVVLSRGLHRERVEGAETVGHVTDEVPVRAMYREWRRLMAG